MTPNSTQVNFDPLNPTDWEKSTYYSRDAQGNVMAIYEYTVVDSTQQNNYTLTERNIYGSSRLGNNHEPIEMIAAPPVDTSKYTHHVGYRQYELSNHLGNVMAVISDRKIARDTSANDTVDYYEPDVLLTFDYSPFGAPLHARSFSKEVCRDTSFIMVIEDLNTDFNDGTTQGWQPLSGSTSMNTTGGTLNLKKQGGSGTVGATQSFTAINGEDYNFTITVSNPCNNSTTIVLELLDANNSLIYTQSVSSGVTTTFNYSFTAAMNGAYTVKVYRTGNNSASCEYYIDDVLVTHQEDVNQQICLDYGSYRWHFNGKEIENELNGDYDYGERMYDPRIGRPPTVDPLFKEFPALSPYQFFSNNPIFNIDLDGLEGTKPPKKGTVSFIVVVNDKEITFSFKEKSPHKIKLEVNGKKKTFDFKTIFKPKKGSRFEGSNENSLILFGPQSDKFNPSAVDAQNIEGFEIDGIKVLDVINQSLEDGSLKIDIVGNVETGNPQISGTKEKLNEFTKSRAKAAKEKLFKNNEGVEALSIFDAIKSDGTGPKEGFETISKPNEDAFGVQIFFRKGEPKKSMPKF